MRQATVELADKPTAPIVFAYEPRPPEDGRPKRVDILARTDRAVLAAQVLRAGGGENNLHSHAHLDGFWYVRRGRARFYTTGNELVAELGAGQGVLIPRGTPYWFESASEDGADTELLQFEVSDVTLPAAFADIRNDRVDHEPLKPGSTARG